VNKKNVERIGLNKKKGLQSKGNKEKVFT